MTGGPLSYQDIYRARQRIRHAANTLTGRSPFLSTLCLGLKILPNTNTSTIAIDGEHIFFNPEWIDTTTSTQIYMSLAHLTAAATLKHHTRRGNRDKGMWTAASFMATMPIILETGAVSVSELHDMLYRNELILPHLIDRNALIRNTYKQGDKYTCEMSAVEHYEDLAQEHGVFQDDVTEAQDESNNAVGEIMDFDHDPFEDEDEGEDDEGAGISAEDEARQDLTGEAGEGPGQGEAEDSDDDLDDEGYEGDDEGPGGEAEDGSEEGKDHSKKPASYDKNEQLQEEQKWDRMVNHAEKVDEMISPDGSGSGAGRYSQLITNIEHEPPSWEEILEEHVTISLSPSNHTWAQPNKRMIDGGTYLPSYEKEGEASIIIALDSSGSMNNRVLGIAWENVKAIVGAAAFTEIRFIQCDGIVQSDETYHDVHELPEQLEAKGRGGTHFYPTFDKINDVPCIDPPQLMIYISDLEAGRSDYPKEEPDFPVVWLHINTRALPEKENTAWGGWFNHPPFGEVVYIDPNKALRDHRKLKGIAA